MRTLRIMLALSFFFLNACSVYMASKQPDKKDLDALVKGTPQSVFRAELGEPVWKGEENGSAVEVYKFKQGYSKGTKIGRAFFHGAADVMTLGLWEVVGTPLETYASGTNTSVRVVYDDRLCTDQVEIRQGKQTTDEKSIEPEKKDD